MQHLSRPMVCVSLFLFVPVLCLGCGGKAEPALQATAPVSGVVVYKGKPIKDAQVTLHPQGPGNPANGRTEENGRFVLTTHKSGDGAVIGFHLVTVQVFPMGGLPGYELESTGGTVIPAKYKDEKTSPLTVEVKPGPNNLELKLED